MKPRNAAVAGGVAGLALGFILLSGIPGGALFGMLVGGFVCYEAVWALNEIKTTKKMSKNIRKKQEQKDAEQK